MLSVLQGCGLKPSAPIPSDVTADQVAAALDRQTGTVDTFSGTASVYIRANGSSESATILIRYISPGLFRLYLKGFAGIDIGRISALSDSVTVYIPPENIYLKAGRNDIFLKRLFPEIDLDMRTIELLFNGTFPPEDERNGYEISMNRIENEIELTMARGSEMYRYRVAGAGLRLVREEYLSGGELVWRKTLTDYDSYDGVVFPGSITVERGGDRFSIRFSECEINGGLSEADLTFNIPASAERMFFESVR